MDCILYLTHEYAFRAGVGVIMREKKIQHDYKILCQTI